MELQIMKRQHISQLMCKNYLYIKASEHSDYVPLDEYYENIIKKNPRFKFTHKRLSSCKFRYRGKTLKYNELCTVNCNQMELPLFYDSTAISVEKFGTATQEKGYCLRLLNTFDRYLGKARYETIKAATLLDVDYLNSDTNVKPYVWQYFQRCYNAENAIYTYYSLYEIVILLIFICERKGCGLSFEEYAKKCKSGQYRNHLEKADKGLYFLVSDGTSKAKIRPDFAKVCDWCNTFKHRGILRFEGEKMDNPLQSVFIPDANNDAKPYFSANNEFKYIDLDEEVIPELFEYHKRIIDLASKVIDHCRIKEKEITTVEEAPNG